MKDQSAMTARDQLLAHASTVGLDSLGKARVSDTPRVALLVETARSFGREFLSGAAHYARLHGPWIFHITPGDFEQAVPEMKQWGGTGIIARIPNDCVAQAILETGLPTIALGLSDEQHRPATRWPVDLGTTSASAGRRRIAASRHEQRHAKKTGRRGAEASRRPGVDSSNSKRGRLTGSPTEASNANQP